jgi:hypothetical protein
VPQARQWLSELGQEPDRTGQSRSTGQCAHQTGQSLLSKPLPCLLETRRSAFCSWTTQRLPRLGCTRQAQVRHLQGGPVLSGRSRLSGPVRSCPSSDNDCRSTAHPMDDASTAHPMMDDGDGMCGPQAVFCWSSPGNAGFIQGLGWSRRSKRRRAAFLLALSISGRILRCRKCSSKIQPAAHTCHHHPSWGVPCHTGIIHTILTRH